MSTHIVSKVRDTAIGWVQAFGLLMVDAAVCGHHGGDALALRVGAQWADDLKDSACDLGLSIVAFPLAFLLPLSFLFPSDLRSPQRL